MSEFDHRPHIEDLALTRRELLGRLGNGFAGLSLLGMLASEAEPPKQKRLVRPLAANQLCESPGAQSRPLPAKAKRVVFLFANGGPSHVDSFDPKPMLTKHHGEPLPYNNLPTERRTGTCFKSPFEFKKYGQSGIEVSDLFPNVGSCIDDICVIRSMHADVPNHEPSLLLMNCGDARRFVPPLAVG